MALAVGTRLGSFEITGTLGAGGMGEVYLARDTGLKRDVALKVLPATFASDPDRVARFQREAELLATLAHPHIAAIHGLTEADGVRALVLELVPGETLAERVSRGPVPVDETLGLARQLADALDYAHEHGVVHRDLKPANVKVTPDGELKVLDFGLAKALEGPHPFSVEAAHSPTLTSPAMTEVGMLLGTAAYMSPEQARGKPVDKRADIWAFGCVVYELLTGVRAFEGETLSDTLAAVLKSEPDWTRLPADTPASLTTLLRHCLTRDAKERLRDIGDAWRVLGDRSGSDDGLAAPSPPVRAPRSRPLPWALAATLGAALTAVVLQWAPWRAAPAAPVHRFSVDLGVEATLRTDIGTAAVLSPDGQLLAFAAYPLGGKESRLFVRRLDQLTATELTDTADAHAPFFSPDGVWIGFFAGGKLKKVEATGGSPIALADAPNPRGAHWTDDGRIVLLPTFGGGQALMQVSEAGGPVTPFIDADPNASQRWPQVLPGGRAVLYTRNQPGTNQSLYLQPLPAGERRLLLAGGYGRYVASGHLVFVDSGALYSMRFDPESLSVSGEAVRILEGLAINAENGAQFSSSAGTLVYRSGSAEVAGVPWEWLDANGVVTPILAESLDWMAPRFSPDGRQLAYLLPATGGQWVLDIARGVKSSIAPGVATTAPGFASQSSAWTPDSKRLAFSWGENGGVPNLYWRRADGSGDIQRLTRSPYFQSQPSWHPSGRWLAFQQSTPPANDIMVVAVDGSETTGWQPGEPSAFQAGPNIELNPAFSPDGRWLAYSSNESVQPEIHVRPFPGPGGRVVVSANGGRFPQWSRTENRLFFVESGSAPSPVMYADYRVEDGAFVPTTPRPWTSRLIMPRRLGLNYALHPDGKRIAAHVAPDTPAAATASDRLVVVTNFLDELRRPVPAR